MKIQVKLVDGATQEYEFDANKTIYNLKEFLNEQTGLAPEQIALIFKGGPLKDDQTLASSNIVDPGPPIHMVAQLRGGFY